MPSDYGYAFMEKNQIKSDFPEHSAPNPRVTRMNGLNVGPLERVLSVAGGVLVASAGTKTRSLTNVILKITGGALIFRGLTGYCPLNALAGRNSARQETPSLEINTSITVKKNREEIYKFWRNLNNLPTFLSHISEVKVIDDLHSHWEANFPGFPRSITWEAKIVEEEYSSRISWQSIEGSMIENAGKITFNDAPGDLGTEIHANISYRLPAGDGGRLIGKLFNTSLERIVKEDISRFKRLLETGEIARFEEPAARKRTPELPEITT